MSARKAALGALLVIYLFFWLGGVGTYVLRGGTTPGTSWAAPVFLLVAGLLAAVSARRGDRRVLLAAAVFGFGSEVVGVRYGWPFGEYQYTDVLAPKLLGVPLVIACAWVTLAAYVGQAVRYLKTSRAARVLLAAAWMTAIDLVIDPLAANSLGYWRWDAAGAYYGIPATNFIGWFAVSALIFAVDANLHRRQPNTWAAFTGLSILLFFTIIALATQLFLAAAIGLILILIHVAFARTLSPAWRLRPTTAVKG